MIRGEIKKGFFTQREVELGTTLSEKVGEVETFDVFKQYLGGNVISCDLWVHCWTVALYCVDLISTSTTKMGQTASFIGIISL